MQNNDTGVQPISACLYVRDSVGPPSWEASSTILDHRREFCTLHLGGLVLAGAGTRTR